MVVLDPLSLAPDPSEVLRYLGCPAGTLPNKKIAQRIDQAINAALDALRARCIYATYNILSRTRRKLTLSGGAVFTGSIGKYLIGVRQVAVFLTTAGPAIGRMAEEAMRKGDVLGGLVYNAIGSHIADAAVGEVAADLRRQLKPGEVLTLPFSPGYCGIPISQQRVIFHLLDARRVGVELLPTLMMMPVKSVSGLFGIGPGEAVAGSQNPCDICSLIDCRMRR